jgi:transcriptional antiterminator NusG
LHSPGKECINNPQENSKKTAERKFFPGYMLINMELTEPSWLLVKNTNNVIGFIGRVEYIPSFRHL